MDFERHRPRRSITSLQRRTGIALVMGRPGVRLRLAFGLKSCFGEASAGLPTLHYRVGSIGNSFRSIASSGCAPYSVTWNASA